MRLERRANEPKRLLPVAGVSQTDPQYPVVSERAREIAPWWASLSAEFCGSVLRAAPPTLIAIGFLMACYHVPAQAVSAVAVAAAVKHLTDRFWK